MPHRVELLVLAAAIRVDAEVPEGVDAGQADDGDAGDGEAAGVLLAAGGAERVD